MATKVLEVAEVVVAVVVVVVEAERWPPAGSVLDRWWRSHRPAHIRWLKHIQS